ncbi:MAG: hypothetical protein AAGF13_07000 [Pseudomonadota bacterium]
MKLRASSLAALALAGTASIASAQSAFQLEGGAFSFVYNDYDFEENGDSFQYFGTIGASYGPILTEWLVLFGDEDFNGEDISNTTTLGVNALYQFGNVGPGEASFGGYFRYVDFDLAASPDGDVIGYGFEGRYDTDFVDLLAFYGVNDLDDDAFFSTSTDVFGIRGDIDILENTSGYVSYLFEEFDSPADDSGDIDVIAVGVDFAASDFIPPVGSVPNNWFVSFEVSFWSQDDIFPTAEDNWTQYSVGFTIPFGNGSSAGPTPFEGQRTVLTEFLIF